MYAEERPVARDNAAWIQDHFVEINEMIGTMPENLPPAESIKKLESQKRKQPRP